MGTTEELPTVISFCSGYGGVERGLDLAGVKHRVIAYVEIEAFAIANLVAKMESGQLDPAPIWTDLKTFPAHLFRDRTSIITGGYPCQPFSAAGKRQGADDLRHLWPYIRQHIQTIRPERTFFENVEGHISLGLSSVISDLEEDGYRTTWGIFSAREVGAPHQRKRVFIMGNAKHDGLFATAERGGDEKADTGRSTEEQSPTRQPARTSEPRYGEGGERGESCGKQLLCGGVEPPRSGDTTADLADTESQRVQGLRTGGKQESSAYGQQELPMCEGERPRQAEWLPEPRVGRVVDGCADRVDRIRLLGNAVVPQTAAKAWKILGERNAKD